MQNQNFHFIIIVPNTYSYQPSIIVFTKKILLIGAILILGHKWYFQYGNNSSTLKLLKKYVFKNEITVFIFDNR